MRAVGLQSRLLLGLAAFFGANLAHAANNLANDWRDYHDGLDRPGYPRADYSPHPIASGAMSSRTLLFTIGLLTALAAILAMMPLSTSAFWGPMAPVSPAL